MNYALPKAMPFRVKAELMVRRGEARDFGHACSIMANRGRRKAQQAQQQPTQAPRLPYKDE